MLTGQVKRYDDQHGFGFIKSDENEEIFVHYSGITGTGFKRLLPGQRVGFVIVEGQKGPQAAKVVPLDDHDQPMEGSIEA